MMKELTFWNVLTNRVGHIWVDKLVCKGCKKQIKGEAFTPSHSFDFYHPSCYKKLKTPAVVMMDDVL